MNDAPRPVARRVPRPRHVGLVSDTHGLVRPEALAALAGCDLIVHAGDVGAPEVLAAFAAIAPLVAVRGNNDLGAWATELPERCAVEWPGTRLFVLHDRKALDFDPATAGYQIVVAGHSHRAAIERRDGVLFINPGSAGPRRFRLPITVVCLEIGVDGLAGHIVELEIASTPTAVRRRR